MKQYLKAIGIVASALAGGGQAAWAHHSTSMFDHAKTVTVHGIVTEVRWVNPHVTLWIKGGLKEGDDAVWGFETTSPGNLVRRGWSRTSIKPGDKVTIEMSPMRDSDSRGGALKKVTIDATGVSFQSNIRDEAPGGQ